jgi:hypothetical protein
MRSINYVYGMISYLRYVSVHVYNLEGLTLSDIIPEVIELIVLPEKGTRLLKYFSNIYSIWIQDLFCIFGWCHELSY